MNLPSPARISLLSRRYVEGAIMTAKRFSVIVFAFLSMLTNFPLNAQPWEGWPYRPEYAFGWGYLPFLGFGYHWRYPNVVEVPADVITAEDIAFCARRFRTYDPVTQTYLGRDGYRYPCP